MKIESSTITSYLRRIKSDKFLLSGCAILFFFICLGIFGPIIAPYDPWYVCRDENGEVIFLTPPNYKNLLGTTSMGRDVFSQLLCGARTALLVGFAAAFVVVFIGANIGLLAGYYGGPIDAFLMRLTDVVYSIPFEPFVIVLVAFLNPSIWNLIFALSLLMWRAPARVIRSAVLSLAKRPFVKAAKVAGASDIRIIYLHIAPNILPIVLLYLATNVAWAITAEAGLSFLGLGDPNLVSWGRMLNTVYTVGAVRIAWWWLWPPGISIILVTASIYLISHAFEKMANPKLLRGR